MKKKIFLLVSIVAISVGLTGCISVDDTEEKSDTVEKKEEKPSNKISINNERFTVKYLKTETVKDDGKPAALIYCTFKNKTSDPKTIHDALQFECYQDGIECELSALQKSNKYTENTGKKIKDGAELQVCITLLLQNEKSNLEIRVLDIEEDLENPVAVQTVRLK